MYQAYFGLKELPFRISPDPRFIYLTSQHQEVLAKCQYSVAEKMGIAAIFGTIGSGKTSLARRLWEQYATQPEYTFALLIHPNYPTPFQFLDTAKGDPINDRVIHPHHQSRRDDEFAVFIIDPVHRLGNRMGFGAEHLQLLTVVGDELIDTDR